MNRKISVSIALAITLIAMTVTFAVTMVISMRIFDNTVSNVMQKQVLNNKIAEIDKYVRGNFFGEIDETYLQDRTARGYVDGLRSTGSTYYTAAEYAELQDMESGKLVGIGIEVIRDTNNYYKIARVYPSSPAEAAKITEGGYITHVDGAEAKTFTSLKALQTAILGAQGTTLNLTCFYEITKETQEFSVQRVNYTAPTVEYQMVENIAYIRISAFATGSFAEFDYAVRQAESSGAQGIVFDVRGNTASQNEFAYNEACRMVDRVSPLGKIGYYQQKNNTERTLPTSDAETYVGLPMVVLINDSTAGAAELFASGIRQLNNAQLAGTKTMGRAMMLSTPQSMSDGSAVSVTIAKVFPASGVDFDLVGIAPDVEVQYQGENTNPYAVDVSSDVQVLRGFEIVRGLAKTSSNAASGATSLSSSSAVESTPPESTAPESEPAESTSVDSAAQ